VLSMTENALALREPRDMAQRGTGFFDRRGRFFKSAGEATESDLANLLGQIGEGESLAPGIAHVVLERRPEIEQLFADHDAMMAEEALAATGGSEASLVAMAGKVAKLPTRPAG
jgi:hypothetical protein